MLRLLTLVLIVGGLALAGHRLISGKPERPDAALDETPAAAAPSADPPPPDAPAARAGEPAGAAPGGAEDGPDRTTGVRDVTPEGVFSGPISPYSPRPAAPPPPAKQEPESQRYFRVMVQDAGTLKAGSRTIRLAGIAAPEGDATCEDENGTEWPCGRAAKAALTLFLRGRAVDCATLSGDDRAITARCRSGDEDLGGWLVAQGWARPDGDGRYAEAGEAARRDRRGLYRAAWRGGEAASSGTASSGAGRATPSLVQD